MTRQVDGVGAGLHDIPEDDIVDVVRLEPALRDRGLGGVDGQVGGGDVLERTAIGAERRALGGEEHDIGGQRLHRVSPKSV